MDNNGKKSCAGNSQHINTSYLFVKETVNKIELTIVYCPTEHVIVDYFTKTL